ncbi:MAG: hypothetical protein KatS3mg028_0667 [Bacteroidia bacterium]|nr:MAG: hypothetical protein KatS3mg028_0667 [Bacteroidia bacterium]
MAKKKKKTKKSTTKKVAKKTTKKVAKKATKKAVKKSTPKKAVKKTTKKVTKKAAKKSTPKKASTKKSTTKKIAPKKTSAKKTTPNKIQKTSTEKFTPHVTSLKPGMPVPYFEGIDQNGNKITSNDLLGRKYVLYFYPKDDTPGCTKEACNIRDNYQRFLDAGFAVYGVSADSIESHKKFIEKYHLPFPLISDTEKNIIRAFDVWGKKQFMGKVHEGIIRTTFVIDENGIISDVITKVEVEKHTDQILK